MNSDLKPKLFNLDNLLILQGISFTSAIFIPTLVGRWIHLEIYHMSLEEILSIALTLIWAVFITRAFTEITFVATKDVFYLILVFGLTILLLGVGIHLVSNQFNDYLFELENSVSEKSRAVAYFYDELLSHYMIVFGYLSIIFAFTLEQRAFVCQVISRRLLIFAAILNGVSLFVIAIEGQVVIPTLVFCIAYLIWNGRTINIMNTIFVEKSCTFYFLSVVTTTFTLSILWGLYNFGFPSFSSSGLL
jgi:hypothetical protein